MATPRVGNVEGSEGVVDVAALDGLGVEMPEGHRWVADVTGVRSLTDAPPELDGSLGGVLVQLA